MATTDEADVLRGRGGRGVRLLGEWDAGECERGGIMLRHIVSVWVIAAALVAAGCASTYYKVTDLGSGRAYYTDQVVQHPGGGVSLVDARTGDNVTLQNSDITVITKEEYTSNRIAK